MKKHMQYQSAHLGCLLSEAVIPVTSAANEERLHICQIYVRGDKYGIVLLKLSCWAFSW
jgi:hypothetical protein